METQNVSQRSTQSTSDQNGSEERKGLYLEPPKSKKIQARDNLRVKKWQAMLTDYVKTTTRKKGLFKSRIRKGIPPTFRGVVWLKLANCEQIRQQLGENLYNDLLAQPISEKIEMQINMDIPRTYPTHPFFAQEHTRESLRNVLHAYAIYDPEVGYCQGMSYITSILILHMAPENAFWMLMSLMQNYDMRDFFLASMVGVRRTMYVASRIFKTKYDNLWSTLDENGVKPYLFSVQWFMTMFSSVLSYSIVARIWDVIFAEGPKILYRIFLGMMNLLAKDLQKMTFEEAMNRIKQYTDEVDGDRLIKTSLNVRLKRKWLEKYRQEYLESPKEEFLM